MNGIIVNGKNRKEAEKEAKWLSSMMNSDVVIKALEPPTSNVNDINVFT